MFWKPIEIAPKCKLPVLVTWSDTWRDGSIRIEAVYWHEHFGWVCCYDGDRPASPTHWTEMLEYPVKCTSSNAVGQVAELESGGAD